MGTLPFGHQPQSPSFSSKGFPDVKTIIDVSGEYLSGEVLVSAYDIKYFKLTPQTMTFADLLFVDSGGYEISADLDLSDQRNATYVTAPKPWLVADHRESVKLLPQDRPVVLVSYDNPNRRQSFEVQLKRAKKFFDDHPWAISEFLIKTEPHLKHEYSKSFVNLDKVIAHIDELTEFDILAFTEKELGPSIFKRMEAIARVRIALNKTGSDVPIHVFGSLDPISTPLYFLSGADYFDGLTWLRYAYLNGYAIYNQNFGATQLNLDDKVAQMNNQISTRNFTYLQNLQDEMRQFLDGHAFKCFGAHSELFERAARNINEHLGEA